MDSFDELFNGVYGWKIKDSKCVPPDYPLPDCVNKRIKWAYHEIANGLTFLGVLTAIFAYDEEKTKKDWYLGAEQEWLPVSDEFRKWRDGVGPSMKQNIVALIIIYGNASLPVDDKNNI